MKRLFKKFVTLALAAATLTSSTAVFAQNEMTNMVFEGYDVSDLLNPYYIYNEVINGDYTDKQVLVRVPDEAIKFVVEGFEGVYPYAGYSRMYIDNPTTEAVDFEATNATAYNNLSPQWASRRQDWIFELTNPYTIVERQQTNVPGKGWTWDFGSATFGIGDHLLRNRTTRHALIDKIEWVDYGFGEWDNNFEKLDAYLTIYDVHCTACKVYSIACDDCRQLLPIEFWSKEDAEMLAAQARFGVIDKDDVYFEALGDNYVDLAEVNGNVFNVADMPELVAYVRACNKHIDECRPDAAERVACMHEHHPQIKDAEGNWKTVRPTIASELLNRYDINGWYDLYNIVLTPANLSARGKVVQDAEKYPREVYGNLLTNEGINKFYLSDDVIAEMIPMIKALQITGRFNATTPAVTVNVVEKYIEEATAGLNFNANKRRYVNAILNDATEWAWPEIAEYDDNQTFTRPFVAVPDLDLTKAPANIATTGVASKFWNVGAHETVKELFNVLEVKYGVGKIEWTAPSFEEAIPHKYYQYMILDGTVLDGTNHKPLVWRYTGSNANPKVEWKFESFKAITPNNGNILGAYATVERMYINGNRSSITRVPAIVFNADIVGYNPDGATWHIGNPELKFAYSYLKSVEGGKYTDYYITDNNGNDIRVYRQINHGTIVDNSVNPNNNVLEYPAAQIGINVTGVDAQDQR